MGRQRAPPAPASMTLPHPNIRSLAAAAVVFAAALGVLTMVNRPAAQPPLAPPSGGAAQPLTTQARVAALQASIAAGDARPLAYTSLGDAYVQLYRESGDASYLTRADGTYRAAVASDPRDAAGVTGLGTLAAARHDFRGALRYGLEALRLSPNSLIAYPVIVDAQVELGRYGDAGRTLQRMVDLKPGLAAYARASYFRELHGDLDGAAAALDLAASAGGGAPENVAYVQSLLGHVEFARGRLGASEAAYREALQSVPSYAPADAGLARVQAARGDLTGAIDRLHGVVDRLPLPEYAILLVETELAAGRHADAVADVGVVQAEERLLAANGVNTDVDLSIFEADHGSPARAVALARRGWSAAPSVRSADALGWSLTRDGDPVDGYAWARRALRLGSRDPLFLYPAGTAARGARRIADARRLLRAALALNPRFSPLYGPAAEQALRGLR
jgi:tetratricopeptide (TPR) repeat protein